MFQNLHRCWSYYCDMKVKCPTCSESSKQQQQHQQQQQPQQQMQHQQKWINIDEVFLYTDCSGACGSDSRLVGCWFWASFLSKLAHVHRNLLELCPWVEYNLPWPPSLPVGSWVTGGVIATIVTPGSWAPCPGYWRPMVGCSVTGRAWLLVAEEMTPDYIDWLLWFILHRPPPAEVIILLELGPGPPQQLFHGKWTDIKIFQ